MESKTITKRQLTGMIHSKNWMVSDFLKYVGRSQDFFHRNSHGSEQQRLRLYLMICGLPEKE